MLKIGIIGAGGRMGRHCIAAVIADPDARLAAALEAEGSPFLGQDAACVAGLPACGVHIQADTAAAFAAADVMVDFSFCGAFPAVLREALRAKKPLVVGTTGLCPEDMQAILDAAKRIPVFQSNNYSIGIAVLRELVQTAAKKLGKNFDIEIVETHHRHKKDAPSGTAITLAEAAAAGRGYRPEDAFCYGREGISGERPEREIALHALRGGEVVGEHTVYFFGEAERLMLGHSADSRMNFALGAIRAASWLAAQPPGRYGIEHLLAPDA
ncbi:MAG: 4-hydroxy-tetrahydrodipicolinate reductase [Spirochaetota bacterium]|jgi:4-hydroxy-tetrahydrodipicolinate reductase|nr:4-hydroxy-tetrahydrodipicolinate reductase [Spirochaetota bacterium]